MLLTTTQDIAIEVNRYADAFRGAVLRLLSHRRINDAIILSCLESAKTGLSFRPMMERLIDPGGVLSRANASTHWARSALARLKADGWVDSIRKSKRHDVWSITTAGRVMIHRLNREAIKIMAERLD